MVSMHMHIVAPRMHVSKSVRLQYTAGSRYMRNHKARSTLDRRGFGRGIKKGIKKEVAKLKEESLPKMPL